MSSLAVIWRSAGTTLAVHARDIVEVLPPLACRAVPGVPGWVRGLFVFRGKLIPLIDCSLLLGLTESPQRMMNRVLVVRIGAAGGPEWPIGLWVESILDVGSIEFTAAESHPGFAAENGRFLGPVAPTRWGLVQLIHPSHLFTPDQLRVLTERLQEAAA
jgi:chemotaxis-related protein WspB